MNDVHLSTARHFRYELPLGGKFSAAIWSAGGVPRIITAHNFVPRSAERPRKCNPVRDATGLSNAEYYYSGFGAVEQDILYGSSKKAIFGDLS